MKKRDKYAVIFMIMFYAFLFFAVPMYVNSEECGGCGQDPCCLEIISPSEWYWIVCTAEHDNETEN